MWEYRGKSIKDNSWVYGYLFKRDEKTCFILCDSWTEIQAGKEEWIFDEVRVTPESVGKFTGFSVKDVDVCVGDIIKGRFPIERTINGTEDFGETHITTEIIDCIGVVEYQSFCGAFVFEAKNLPPGYWQSNNSFYRYIIAAVFMEVIGNLTDNLELLKEL